MPCELCVVFFLLVLVLHVGAKYCRRMIFLRIHLFIWATGGHELGTLSIRVHNSLTVYGNSWALKFDHFSEFQSALSDIPAPTSLWRFAYKNRCVTHSLLSNSNLESANSKILLITLCIYPKTLLMKCNSWILIRHRRIEH